MPGTIIFKPIEANLNLGKDLLSKADPYCQFSVGGQQIKGQVCKSGGKHPVWEDSITVPASNQTTCFVELKDKDLLKDEKLGSFEIDLREIESQGRLKKWYPIYHKDKPAGEILMEAIVAPQGGQGFIMEPGMPTQIIQSQTIPVQPVVTQKVTQTYGVPVGTLESVTHMQSQGTAIQIEEPQIRHHAIEIGGPAIVGTEVIKTRAISTQETPFQVPNASTQTQTVKTIKETVILPGVQTQSVFVGAQPQVAPMNMTDTALLNPIMTESLSEQYAREALIRGLDPLGTQIYQYPVGPTNQSFGGPNLQQSGLVGSHLPGQYGQVLPGVAGQTLVGQYIPGQNPQPGLPVATHMLESNRLK